MTQKSWISIEQDMWLNLLIPACFKAKEAKNGPDFITKKAKLFFWKWPVLPRPEDLEEAKGDEKVATHLTQEARTTVCLGLSLNLCILLIEDLLQQIQNWFHNHTHATTLETGFHQILKLTGPSKLVQPWQAFQNCSGNAS